jgi:hypothetical protein
VKDELLLGVAVRVTTVPLTKLYEQVAPQRIPDGEELMVPVPVPAGVMVSVYIGTDTYTPTAGPGKGTPWPKAVEAMSASKPISLAYLILKHAN